MLRHSTGSSPAISTWSTKLVISSRIRQFHLRLRYNSSPAWGRFWLRRRQYLLRLRYTLIWAQAIPHQLRQFQLTLRHDSSLGLGIILDWAQAIPIWILAQFQLELRKFQQRLRQFQLRLRYGTSFGSGTILAWFRQLQVSLWIDSCSGCNSIPGQAQSQFQLRLRYNQSSGLGIF